AEPDPEEARHGRDGGVAHRPHATTVRQLRFFDGREYKRPSAAGLGKARTVDPVRGRGHETTAASDSGTASSVRPRGTMLSETRRSGRRCRATACRTDAAVAF